MPKDRGTALVTGASSGIGAAFARAIARQGYDLILTARRLNRLEDLSKQLETETGREAKVVSADLSQSEDVERLTKVISAGDPLTLLVNNAGFGGYGPFVDADPSHVESILAVHVGATVHLTRAVLPRMTERGEG